MNFKCQVGLIDIMSQVAAEFKFILVDQDHFTKCVQFLSVKNDTSGRGRLVLLSIVAVLELHLFRKVITAVNLLT
jgi:hypothetical protein